MTSIYVMELGPEDVHFRGGLISACSPVTPLTLNLQELTRRMAQYWQSLVPLPQSALDTISDGAYYTLLIEDNLRLVSFNSDYG